MQMNDIRKKIFNCISGSNRIRYNQFSLFIYSLLMSWLTRTNYYYIKRTIKAYVIQVVGCIGSKYDN